MEYRIPFNRPSTLGNERRYMLDALKRGQISGDGYYTKRCEALLRQRTGSAACLLTTSCTHAMEMAGMLYGLDEGDEFILPSFTFVSTANAFALRGAKPRFVDIRRDTLNLDEELLADAFTHRTRLVVPVHYAGIGCAMEAILSIARDRGAEVFEDAAQGIGATHGEHALGTWGSMGALSFHETKNVHCGEGGALLIGREAYLERAEILREKGTNRSQFFRGEVDKYTWVDLGSSYVLSDLLAAYLLAQLEGLDGVMEQRGRLWEGYRDGLLPLQEQGKLVLPPIPRKVSSNHHIFWMLAEDETTRDRLIAHLKGQGILSVFHYVPLHLSPYGRRLQEGNPPHLPVTEDIASRLLRLPLYYSLSSADQNHVIETIHSFYG